MSHTSLSFHNQKLTSSLGQSSFSSHFDHPQKTLSQDFHKVTMSDAEMKDCDQGCLDMQGNIPRCPASVNTNNPPMLSLDEIVKALTGKVLEVEGNIGCGKSTLTKLMSKICNNHVQGITDEVTVESLAVKDGTSSILGMDGHIKQQFALVHDELVNPTFLGAFYQNSERYGFAFQMYMLTTRLYQMQNASDLAKDKGHFAILDRGAVGDALFALHNSACGNISDEEMSIYRSVCTDRLPPSLSHNVDMVLYLDVSPDQCYHRMNSMRQRDAEKEVVPDYLYGIDTIYFNTFMKWLGYRPDACDGIDIGKPPAVVIIDWSEFGCAKTILNKLAHAALSIQDNNPITGMKPKVEFMTGIPQDLLSSTLSYDIIYTIEQLEPLYQQLMHDKQIYNRNGDILQHLVIDWTLSRDESYKRVCMKILSNGGSITFFNSDHDELLQH